MRLLKIHKLFFCFFESKLNVSMEREREGQTDYPDMLPMKRQITALWARLLIPQKDDHIRPGRFKNGSIYFPYISELNQRALKDLQVN